MERKMVVPSHIQIETVAGICNYSCIMCPIEQSIRNEIMSNERFTRILERLRPYLEHQEFLSLCGLGETLIDKKVAEKIEIAKRLGFRGTGVYTNGELLVEETARGLLNAELDTIVVSIDGFTSRVQSMIRVGSNLDKVISNVERLIALRDGHSPKTRVMIRFTKQELNEHEATDFHDFWQARIRSKYGDTVSIYNIHNSGRSVLDFMTKPTPEVLDRMKGLKCPEIYERVMINSDGSLSFCCGDQFGHHQVGSILDTDLIDLYNSKFHTQYREAMNDGRILELELCKDCTVAHSIATRTIIQVGH